jgi:ATP-dependent Clp protease ATP-binding subunit ClpB
MTSNLGSEAIQTLSEEGDFERIRSTVMGVVAQHFRPEFINRVDDIVVFHPLNREQVREIAGLQFHVLEARLADQDIEITITDQALDALVDEGYDPVYGARPLKRVIQKRLENTLASRLLAGEFATGDVIRVDFTEGEFTFSGGG